VWYELGQRLVEMTDARVPRILFSLTVGGAAALIDIAVRKTFGRAGGEGLDALAVAIFISAVTYVQMKAVNARRYRLLLEVAKVAELNHQVRNALQSIRYAAHLGAEEQYVQVIDESVKRIDSVLKALFPIVVESPGNHSR
jgi:hypothetical protein